MSIAAEIRETVSMWDALEILDIDYEQSAPGEAFILAWDREEDTPSVHVEDTVWYDFGSGKGGDVFAFVQSYAECSFGQALAILRRVSGTNVAAGRSAPPPKERPEPVDLTERVARESRPITEKDDWLLGKLATHHGIRLSDCQVWGLRVGPGDALWIPHRKPGAPIHMVKVRDYRSGKRMNIKGSQATRFYLALRFDEAHTGSIIVEGESDAWAARHIWPHWVIAGLPTGANKLDTAWLDDLVSPVYICLDSDAPGQTAQARYVAEHGFIPLIVPEPFEDLNEAWQAGCEWQAGCKAPSFPKEEA